MSDVSLPSVPPETPKVLKRLFYSVAGAGLVLLAGTFTISQVPSLKSSVDASCKSLRMCSPDRPTDIQEFRSGWLGSGNNFRSAVSDQLSAYRAKYPDWNIDPYPIEERRRKNWGKPSYMYVVGFNVTPKWTGPL